MNSNVVGLEASVDVNTSSDCLTTLENGNIFCVGIPFSTVLISSMTGISGSLVKKNISILVKNTPPSNDASSIKNVCASGSSQSVSSGGGGGGFCPTILVSSWRVLPTLVNVLASFCASDVTLAFLTDIIVSCVVCNIPDELNSASPLLSDTPWTELFVDESVSLNSFVPVLNFWLPSTFGASMKNDPLRLPLLSVTISLLVTFAIAPLVSPTK